MPRKILFYDGACGLCTRSVKFFMAADRRGILQYAPLQGETARACLPEDLREPTRLSTVVYLRGEGELAQLRTRSEAVGAALVDIGGGWRLVGRLLLWIPRAIREWGYRLVARNRMRIFPGGACKLPTQEERQRLLP